MSACIALRDDYDSLALRDLARRSRAPRQVRRLLALAAAYDGVSRTEAAKVGGMDRQTLRDWAHRFNDEGPDGLKHRSGAGRPRLLTQERITWCAQHLFAEETESEAVRASPGKTADLSGLPPALVITAGFDPLRDEGRQYAERLTEAGVSVEFREYEGMVHGFAFMAGAFPQGIELLDRIGRATQTTLGG